MSVVNVSSKNQNFEHPFHLVSVSPWPLLTSVSALATTLGGVGWFHNYSSGFSLMLSGLFLAIFTISRWFGDVVVESTFEKSHTAIVRRGLKYGVILFIVSEVMFFVAFFWAFFHSSLAPTIQIGNLWPPKGIIPLSPWALALFNTLVLLLSGASVTWAHHALYANKRQDALTGLFLTVLLGVIFTISQGFEYAATPFHINDGIFGSCFFLATGFHGLHVIIGTIILIVTTVRLYKYHFKGADKRYCVGFEAAGWYWHFVDVVWLFLYTFVYCWSAPAAWMA